MTDIDAHLGNRFEILSESSRRRRADSRYLAPTRRACHARSFKEGKRRREARREKRRFTAAELLEEQLASDFERTFRPAKRRRCLPTTCKQSAPIESSSGYPQTKDNSAVSSDPAAFHFAGLDLINELPDARRPAASNRDPTSEQTTLLPNLPSWCPRLPSLLNREVPLDDFPLFFDLSKLPEVSNVSKPPSKHQETQTPANLQLLQPKACPRPIRYSRFFPPPEVTHPHAHLARFTCHYPFLETSREQSFSPESTMPYPPFNNTPKLSPREQVKPSPATLWNLLTPGQGIVFDHYNTTIPSKYTWIPRDEVVAAPYGHFDHRLESIGMPVELDSVPIPFPFVHRNSLAGGDDQILELASPDTALGMSGSSETVQRADGTSYPPASLNELAVDEYLALDLDPEQDYADALLVALDLSALPPLPPSPCPSPAPESMLTVLAGYVPATYEDDDDEDVDVNVPERVDSGSFDGEVLAAGSEASEDDTNSLEYFEPEEYTATTWYEDWDNLPDLIPVEEDMHNGCGDYNDEDEDGCSVTPGFGTWTPRPSVHSASAWEDEWGVFVSNDDALGEWEDEWDEEAWYPDYAPSSVAHGCW